MVKAHHFLFHYSKNKTWLANGLYLLLILCFFFYLKQTNTGILEEQSFLNWDAEHYYKIKNEGYQGFLVAFFPLFPLIWKFLNLSIYGISIFNATLFILSVTLLVRFYKIPFLPHFLGLSLISNLFFFVPYTESLFFFCSTLILLGYKSKLKSLIFLGLFLGCLTRPLFGILFLSLLITELFSKNSIKSKIFTISGGIVSILLATFLVFKYQELQTGEWLSFFESQRKWGSFLQLPNFPLTSWGGNYSTRIDASALAIGLIAGLFILKLMFEFFKNRKYANPAFLYSLCYIFGVTMVVVLMRGGKLFSLNRFLFASAFMFIALWEFLKLKKQINLKHLIITFFGLNIFFLLFASYEHIQTILIFAFISSIISILLLLKSERKPVKVCFSLLLTIVLLSFQLYSFQRFLLGYWIA